jgi:rhodanese-related sulfurtransferase
MYIINRRKRFVVGISLVLLILVAVSCAPAATPTLAPTEVPATAAPAATATVAAPVEAAATAAPAATATVAVAATETAMPSGPTLPATNITPTLLAAVPETADGLQVISPEELKAMIEGGADIAIADAQPAEAYAMGHVTGAVNVPWDMQIMSAGGLPMDKLVVVYCACPPDDPPSATDAGDVAMQLITRFGYKKIAVLDGGWVRWQGFGFPTEKGQ